MSGDESVGPDTGGSWSEWFFLGLLLPVGILGLVLFASWESVQEAFGGPGDGPLRERLEVLVLPLVTAGIAWVWVPLTFSWAREAPLTGRGRVLLVALAIVPGAALVLAGLAAAVVAAGG